MRESVIETYLIRQVHKHGGEYRKLRWIGRVGAPDRLVMIPNVGVCWVELKSSTGNLSAPQHREISRLSRCKQNCYVIYSKPDVDAFIDMVFNHAN